MYKKILTLLAVIIFIISCGKKTAEHPAEHVLPQFNITAAILSEISGPLTELGKKEVHENLRAEIRKSLSIICPAIKEKLSEKINSLDEEFYPKGSAAVQNIHEESLKVANDACDRAKVLARSFDNAVLKILNESDTLESAYPKILEAEENYYNMQEKNVNSFFGAFLGVILGLDMLARMPSQALIMVAEKIGASPEFGERQEAEMRVYLKPASAEAYGYFVEAFQYQGTAREEQAKEELTTKLEVLFVDLRKKLEQIASKYATMFTADSFIRDLESQYGKAVIAPLIPYISEQYSKITAMPEKEQNKAMKKFAKEFEERVKASNK